VTSAIPVLLYHSVSGGSVWGTVSKQRFASDVEAVIASQRRSVSISALADGLRDRDLLPDHPIALTFDDGYDDTYHAIELLCTRHLASTVYVTTAQIGTKGRLSPQQLLDLAQMPGVEIGSHGVHHRRLDELSAREIVEELHDSKRHLEDLLRTQVTSFAYPHGAYDKRVREALIAAGYRSGTAVKNAMSHGADDPFAIARCTVTASTSRSMMADIVAGRGAPLAWPRERWRTRVHRTARRERRRLFDWWRPER
jgi:peptidoglycan/xylan/chitin deacetylase (PgdA/CDA1 family)